MANAHEIALRYKSPRYLRLERFDSYVEGTQYDGRHPFLSQSEDAPPVHERAPCIVYGVAKTAIGDLVDFMMGEARYPNISACSSEDDSDLSEGDEEGEGEQEDEEQEGAAHEEAESWGLDEDASALLERWVNGPLSKIARLRLVFPEALATAMRVGAVAVVGVVRNGCPQLEVHPAHHCTPTFDPRTGEIVRLEIAYPYIVDEQDPISLRWEAKCYLYRRVIDALADTVFLPGVGREDGRQPAWVPDPAQSFAHGLGFCPVRWYAFDRIAPSPASYDGRPLHQHLLDEIDALNMSLSQRHRAALYAGDPQIWETGVENDVNPAPQARFSRVTVEAQAAGPSGQTIGVYTASPRAWGRGNARKKGPGVIWRYPDAATKVGILTLPDGALDSIAEEASDLRKKVAEDMGVVLFDPTDIKAFGALSGKAIAFMFARQIARADRIRLHAGEDLILATVDLVLRICHRCHERAPGSMRVPGMAKMFKLLQRSVVPLAGDQAGPQGWFGPRLELQWGRYFPPAAEEENFLVTLCATAVDKGLMPLEVVLEKLRAVFDFGSPEELIEKLKEQREAKQQESLANQDAQMAVQAKYQPADKGTAPRPKDAGKPGVQKAGK